MLDLTRTTDRQAITILRKQADVEARLKILEMADWFYEHNHKSLACSLFHAEAYLSDRLAYELWPHPAGKILVSNWKSE